jgi:hypothetical protein
MRRRLAILLSLCFLIGAFSLAEASGEILLMKDDIILIVVTILGCFVLTVLGLALLKLSNDRQESIRAALNKDLANARATYKSLIAQIEATLKGYELYQASIGREGEIEGPKAYGAWNNNRERECELEALLRSQISGIDMRLRNSYGRIVIPSWLREDQDWQSLQQHRAESEFDEAIDGCKVLP